MLVTPQKALEVQDALTRENLALFVRYAFPCVEPGKDLDYNWHIDCISEYLMAMYRGEITRLVINIPPRYLKSYICSVCLPAWLMGKNPATRVITSSHSESLAHELSTKCRDLIQSPWYHDLFPDLAIEKDRNLKDYFVTTQKGYRRAMYVRSQKGFGQGADWVIWDDITDPQKRNSMATIEEGNKHLSKLVTRLDDKKNGRILGIMQRISHNDPTARCIAAGGYEILSLEFRATKSRIISIGQKKFNIKEGDYLCPTREDAGVERMLRTEMDDYSFNAQYQQNPVPPEGNIFKVSWIQYYDHLDENFTSKGMNIYILVDPANEKKATSDYTAMMVIGLAADQNYYLLDIVRDRLNPTERIQKLFELHKRWNKKSGKPPKVGYEKYGLMADTHFIKETQKQINYRFPLVELHTPVKKEDRIRELIPLFQHGRVYLPKYLMYYNYQGQEEDLVKSFINEEYMAFPEACIHDDMLDAMARITDLKLYAVFPKEKQNISVSISPRLSMMRENSQDNYMDW